MRKQYSRLGYPSAAFLLCRHAAGIDKDRAHVQMNNGFVPKLQVDSKIFICFENRVFSGIGMNTDLSPGSVLYFPF